MVRGRLPMLTGNQGKSRHNSSRRLFVWVEHFSLCRKKGYSGTAIFAQNEPTAVQEDFQPEDHVGEGRAITLDTGDFYLVNTYVPNAQGELARLPYRMEWDRDLRTYLQQLDKRKPVILCGDLNVAHNEIDIARPDANRRSPGFSDEEREGMNQLLDAGFIDTFAACTPMNRDTTHGGATGVAPVSETSDGDLTIL